MNVSKERTLGDRIRCARKKLKLTQEQLGAVAGISGSALSQIESGESKTIKPEHLFKIARKLGKSAQWLLTGEGSETPQSDLADIFAALPQDSSKQTLDFLQYQIERAADLFGPTKLARYMDLLEAFKRDLAERR